MALYKQPKSKYWWFQIMTPEGKRIRKSTKTEDRAKAEVVEKTFLMAVRREGPADLLHAMLDAVLGRAVKTSLGLDQVWHVYTEWLRATGKELEKTTLNARASALRRLSDWAKKDYPAAEQVEAVDRAAATAFAASLADAGMKGKTRQNILGDLSAVWEALRRSRDGITNPWPLVRPEVNDSERGKPFTREQEAEILMPNMCCRCMRRLTRTAGRRAARACSPQFWPKQRCQATIRSIRGGTRSAPG